MSQSPATKTVRDAIKSCGFDEDEEIEDLISYLDAEGFVIVPKVPTPKMLAAAGSITGGGFQNSRSDEEIYETMIAASGRD